MLPDEMRHVRKLLCFSQTDLAHALGYSGKRHVSRWESGETDIPPIVAVAVRGAYYSKLWLEHKAKQEAVEGLLDGAL